jgi:hypothetical protein
LAITPEEEGQAREMLQQQIDDLVGFSNIGTSICIKENYELIELEESIKNDEGCWIKFMKTPIPAAENEDPKAKKAPAKAGKAAV